MNVAVDIAPTTTSLPFVHSTANFTGYYHAFNRLYGLFLFITFCTKFAAMLGINPHTLRARMKKLGIDWAAYRDSGKVRP